MSESAPAPSREEIGLFSFRVWSYKQGEMVALLVHLGDHLGLYRAMAGAGPLGAAELAARAGLYERWVTEWLRGNGAATSCHRWRIFSGGYTHDSWVCGAGENSMNPVRRIRFAISTPPAGPRAATVNRGDP